MNFLKILKKTVIDSQIYVSIMGTLFAVFFMKEQNTFRFPTVLLIFITYFSGYLYTKYQYTRHFMKILALNAVAGIICAFLIIHNHNEIRLLKWFIIVVLGLLYNSFFLDVYIRKIPLLKVFYVGLVWALVNCWLTLPEFSFPIFFISFFFITALVLPFDIRDMNSDTVQTFPKLIGVQNTKYTAYILVFTSMLIAVFYLKPVYNIAFFLSGIITFILIYFSENKRDDTYFSFWVETSSALPFLFLLIMEYF
ncbi:prenyltransferase [Chryseobacterium oranimense G311]|nr:prenyltransferase [Chryseobacterium oranimense G311]